MKRREFLVGSVAAASATATATAAATVAATGLSAPAIAQGKQEWKMVMPWPKNAPGVGVNAQRFAAMVTEMTDGRLTIKPYGGGELVPPLGCLDAVQSGVAECSHGTPYYWAGKAKALNYFTTVPFGLMSTELVGWITFGDGQALWEETYAPFNVQPFFTGTSGVQAGGWFRKEINSLDDLKGLKMRIAGLGGEVMRRLGTAVVMTPPGEITTAMLSGTVDAAEWVGPWNDIAFGLHKAAKYYYMPAFHEPGPGLEVIVNKDRFAELPKDIQAIIRRAAQASTAEATSDFMHHNIQAFGQLDELGVEKRLFPEEVIKAMGKATVEVLDEVAATDDLTRRVHDSYMDYVRKATRYQSWFDRRMLEMREMVWGV